MSKSKNYLDPFDPRYPDAAERLKTAPVQMIDPTTCPNRIMVPSHYRPDKPCMCYEPKSKQMRDWGYHWNKAKRHYAAWACLALALSVSACAAPQHWVAPPGADFTHDRASCQYEAIRAVPYSSGRGDPIAQAFEQSFAVDNIRNACLQARGYTLM